MEEVTREIALSLSMKTIFISILAAGGTIAIAVILKPIILITRDLMAWKYIEKFYTNEETKNNIRKLHRFKARTNTQFSEECKYIVIDGDLIEAYIGADETDENYVFIYQNTQDFIQTEIIRLKQDIDQKKKRLSFILQHLGMNTILPPLDELEEEYEEHYKKNIPRKIKIDYDWTEDEALKEIKKHL